MFPCSCTSSYRGPAPSGSPKRHLSHSLPLFASSPYAFFSLTFFALASVCFSQTAIRAQNAKPKPQDNFQQHYDAARTFQLSGDQQRAAAEYSAFLAGALRTSAKAAVAIGELDHAASLFDQALLIAPDDPETRLDNAQLLIQQEKLSEARSSAEKVLASSPDNARANSLLGQVLFAQKDYKGAREHLELAVVAAPGFDIAYLLGMTYIKLNDLSRARLVFDDMRTAFGDTARLHIYFGMAYRKGEMYDDAILELKKAISKNSTIRQAHYFLALAYLARDGESGFAAALAELQAEVKVDPNDARTHYLLGYIAMKQRNFHEAEVELSRSTSLDPQNPDPLLYLGQLYADADRRAEAEAAMRKAIALTKDEARNDFQISRAHYVLGRILQNAGKPEEGKKELLLSSDLRQRSLANMRSQFATPESAKDVTDKKDDFPGANLLQETESQVGAPTVEPVSPEQEKKVQAYLDQLKPAIADAYNNLGVILAGRKEFGPAAEYFRKAGEWSPSLKTLDRNWGMAAFYAARYQDAVPPLTRQLQKQPDDVRVRAALGLSLFMVQNFNGTLETLKPIQSQVDGDPGLAYAFAVSLVKTGSYDEGMRRLKSMEEANPKSADLHMMLGSAFADQHEYDTALQEYRKSLAIDPNQAQTHYLAGLALIRNGHPKDAVEDLRTALKLNPSDVSAKYHLAFALIQIQQKEEAQSLLRDVIQQDPKRADAYYELGKLQLEEGDTKGAVLSLETGTKVGPEADYIHYQLAMAYRRDSREEDAQREIKLYQTLKNRQRGRGNAPQSD
jgi:tetratricopeptide (TPR) repeat protein